MTSDVNKPDQFGRGTSSAPDDEKILNDEKPLPPVTGSISQPRAVDSKIVYRKQPDGLKFTEFDIVELPPRNLHPLSDGKPDVGLIDPLPVTKSLDPNRYATKKTIAQGMLDIALLTANASQLKYILQIGKQHEFYTLMLTLICLSIGLQVIQGLMCLLLGSSININKQKDHKKAELCNNLVVTMMMITVVVNIVISVFEMNNLVVPIIYPKNITTST